MAASPNFFVSSDEPRRFKSSTPPGGRPNGVSEKPSNASECPGTVPPMAHHPDHDMVVVFNGHERTYEDIATCSVHYAPRQWLNREIRDAIWWGKLEQEPILVASDVLDVAKDLIGAEKRDPEYMRALVELCNILRLRDEAAIKRTERELLEMQQAGKPASFPARLLIEPDGMSADELRWRLGMDPSILKERDPIRAIIEQFIERDRDEYLRLARIKQEKATEEAERYFDETLELIRDAESLPALKARDLAVRITNIDDTINGKDWDEEGPRPRWEDE